MGHQVGVTVGFFVHLRRANLIVTADRQLTSSHRVLARNGGLPTMASNPGFSRSNTSGNSSLPVERCKRRILLSRSCEPTSVCSVAACDYCVGVFSALGFPLLWLGPVEEGSHRQIPEEPHFVQFVPSCARSHRSAQFPVGGLLARFADEHSQIGHLGHHDLAPSWSQSPT